MKRLNPVQIAASASGAVLSALIASVFGVSGTVIGVAVGSIVATTVTAIVWESIERTHSKVRDVVVQKGHRLPLVHRWATRGAAGEVKADVRSSAIEASVDAGPGSEPASGNAPAPGSEPASGNAPAPGSEPASGNAPARSATAGAPDLEEVGETRLVAWSRARIPRPTPAGAPRRPARQPRWPLVVTVAASFVLALGLVTLVEVLGGRPLSSLIGASSSSGGTSAGNFLTSTPPEAPPAATTTTTAPPRTTTTTSTSTTTTTTTTTSPSTSTTTTTATPGASSASAGGVSVPGGG